MTKYNKRTYRIDDIDADKNPLSTFHYKKQDKEITFKEYYSIRYQENSNITDDRQMLLVVKPSKRDKKLGDDQPIYLIPELCPVTGLDDGLKYTKACQRMSLIFFLDSNEYFYF